MKSVLIAGSLVALSLSVGAFYHTDPDRNTESELASELTFVEGESIVDDLFDPFANWQRPPGPPKVALQVGHWKNNELPDEFQRLREEGGGARGGGKAEWEVALEIAERTAELLRADGITAEILPATIPPQYWADVLVSIHADGNTNTSVSGYKVAAPRRDRTEKAQELASLLEEEYGKLVALPLDPNITRNMRGYYAFNWRRYVHAMHPMTVGTIIETGFLTSPRDRAIIVNQPELPAQGIANGIRAFFKANPPT
jgi:N-acetylmuramoyl-L-alanine amidase